MTVDLSDRWEPRPTPVVTPDTEPFWRAASEGEYKLPVCRDCGLVFYYPRAACPDCHSDAVDWTTAAGTGELYSFAIGERVGGWPEDALPLVVAYVTLDEGPRVMTNVEGCDPSTLSIGDRVEVRFVPTEDSDVAVPVFTPV